MSAGRPSRSRAAYRRITAHYGADPLHLLALLACFALAGYAASRVFAAGIWVGFAIWFVGAAVAHDLVLFPLYALADVAVQRRRWGRRRPGPHVHWTPWINYVRVPVGLSGLLLLVWFPLILRRSGETYRKAVGLDSNPFLGRWLLVTGVLFAGSAVAYAVRLRRSTPRRRGTRRGRGPERGRRDGGGGS
ncbi:hypothetical protein NE236_24820 [Actinoallomurus purpureus]|uniref:hypothetical protein n=1 Tax=Actinoallomurus purpureus TaxID=478114 RepID=UPI0020939A54|nr:hypothetical protein [Actinoallomurus purpureus]MCO6008206.1 hypothetical protein [Actinoallomurus purpureus]